MKFCDVLLTLGEMTLAITSTLFASNSEHDISRMSDEKLHHLTFTIRYAWWQTLITVRLPCLHGTLVVEGYKHSLRHPRDY
jgi:hypothetical protein